MSDPLEGLARKAAREPFFLSSLLEAFARSEELDDAGLARRWAARCKPAPAAAVPGAAARSGGVSARHRLHCRQVRRRSAAAGRGGEAWPGGAALAGTGGPRLPDGGPRPRTPEEP